RRAPSSLQGLGALDARGHITAHGRVLAGLPLHPRLGHMLTVAGPEASTLAALLAERDPLRGAGPDLALRLQAVARPGPEADRGVVERIRTEARRLEAAALALTDDRPPSPKARAATGSGGPISNRGAGAGRSGPDGFSLARWQHSPTPTGSGFAARGKRRAGCCRVARGPRWRRGWRCPVRG
ncbi:MAG: hypothetical protein EON47_16335, partial [Acetobacteraceae bacterium]